MKVVVWVCIFVICAVTVAAAPTLEEDPRPQNILPEDPQLRLQQYLRERRSQYSQYSPHYYSPCAAAAASSPVPAVAGAGAYQMNMSPYHGYSVPHPYADAMPHYRSEDPMELEHELLGFSDMDHILPEQVPHMPFARFSYGAAPAASHSVPSSLGQMTAPSPSGPAFGVFPNANVGGCSVPLLFSCSPSIIQGRIVSSQPHYAYASGPSSGTGSANAYRVVDEHLHAIKDHDEHREELSHQDPLQAHAASHATAPHQ